MRRCIFCGNRANTIEHVWPKWAVPLITRPGKIIAGEVTWGRGDAPNKTFPARGESASPQVKHLCNRCNSGWMSDLEAKTRPILGPVINDVSILLDRDIQSLIAAWSFKNAVVLQCAGNQRFYTEAERRHLLSSTLPPSVDTMIWIARHDGDAASFFETNGLYQEMPSNDAAMPEGYVTTFALSHLAIQVFSYRRKAEHKGIPVNVHMKPGPWAESLLQIWPTIPPVRWPPRVTLDLAWLHALSARFSSR